MPTGTWADPGKMKKNGYRTKEKGTRLSPCVVEYIGIEPVISVVSV